MGVDPPGVSIGVVIPGVPCGVAAPGVILGVAEPKAGVELDGVSSHRDRRLLAEPGSDSAMESAPIRSARGVSAHPLLCPGVSETKNSVVEDSNKSVGVSVLPLSVFGVSSQRFLRVDFSCEGVSVRPGVIARRITTRTMNRIYMTGIRQD